MGSALTVPNLLGVLSSSLAVPPLLELSLKINNLILSFKKLKKDISRVVKPARSWAKVYIISKGQRKNL